MLNQKFQCVKQIYKHNVMDKQQLQTGN